jgi:S-adenosylmethionine decarboxylase
MLTAVRTGELTVYFSRSGFSFTKMLTVGTEWLVEASGCDAAALRDERALRAVFARVIEELSLCVVGSQLWHKFPGEGGVTGLAMLTESHLACHTYPEFGVATFNLYCCRERAAWAWDERLPEMLGAQAVCVRSVRRASQVSSSPHASSSLHDSSLHDSLPLSVSPACSLESSAQTLWQEGDA